MVALAPVNSGVGRLVEFSAFGWKEKKMAHPIILNGHVWCPLCKDYVQLLRIQSAAKLTDVNRRTIYRYIEEGSVYAIKVAGKTYRVCSGCLLKAVPSESRITSPAGTKE